MTIIQPYKSTYKINFLIFILMFVSIGVAVFGMFIYNQLVNLRHEISKYETNLSRAEVKNAELKNNLYSITDANKLESLADTQGLVLDKNPEYVKTANNVQLTTNN